MISHFTNQRFIQDTAANSAFTVKSPSEMWRFHTIALAVCKKGGDSAVAIDDT